MVLSCRTEEEQGEEECAVGVTSGVTWPRTYLEEGALGLQGTGEVVGVGAAEAVAAARGAGLLAVSTA